MYPSQTEDSANFGISEQKNPIAWKFSGKKTQSNRFMLLCKL